MIDDLFLRYFSQGFAYGFFDNGKGLLLFIHVVKRYIEVRRLTAVRRQHVLVQAIGFAHESAQAVALHGVLEERFGCPYEDPGW